MRCCAGAGKKRTRPKNKNRMKKLTLFLGLLGLVLKLQAAPVLPAAAARADLRNGALVIDVRTAKEFQAGHLTNVINIPLDQLAAKLPRQVPDKAQVLLLHCRTGQRSGRAEAQLRAMGYTNAFSIGSFEQARKIVAGGAP